MFLLFQIASLHYFGFDGPVFNIFVDETKP